MKNKKIIILVTLITGILIATIGITYSIFTTSKTSKNSSLVVGDIYMHYNETNELKIENAMPTTEYDLTKYFEFTVDGKNTYDKPIYYEIDLTNGDEEVGKTRIDSNLLTFRLTEFKDNVETEIFHNRSYSDLTNKRIHVDTISKSDGNVNRTYRLYVKVGDYTRIGNTEDADYTMEEWNNIYASIKVKVIGDFEEKTIETDPSKFAYSLVYNNEEYVKTISSDFTLNDIANDSEKLKKCVNYILIDLAGYKIGSDAYNNEYSGAEGLCKGEEIEEGLTFLTFLNLLSSQGIPVDYQYLETEGIISDYQGTIKYVNSNKEELDINSIDKNKANIKLVKYTGSDKDIVIPKQIDGIKINKLMIRYNRGDFFCSTLENNNNITNIIILNNVTEISDGSFGCLGVRNIEIPNSVTTIGYNAFANNKLKNIEIPNSVTTIGDAAFSNNQLTNITILEGVKEIGSSAFRYNQLTSVTIPNSITIIGSNAFQYNQLTSITIGNGIQYIDRVAFDKYSSSNPNLSKITINKSCSDIKNIPASSTDTTKYYPWLSSEATGVTIYGSNNEICDSF